MPATETFTDADGVAVAFYRWMPKGDPRAVVLIAHGASEHGARYDRFATFLTEHGFAVFAQDHRGHGNTAKSTGAGLTGPGGWNGLIEDQRQVVELARAAVQGVKVVLFAHSMGSFMSQRFIQIHGDTIDAVVFSGSMGGLEGVEATIELLEAFAAEAGEDTAAPGFPGLNDQFAPARTEYDWLSRDDAEVDKYIADPFCGDDMPLSFGYARGMLETLSEAWKPENEAQVPKALPVLLITGDMDPVSGNAATVHDLEARYKANGMTDVTGLYYPDARHELLNETNRDSVQQDVLEWIERVIA